MNKRTVHVQLPDIVIAACYDLLESTGHPHEVPAARAVSGALGILVTSLREGGQVNAYTEEDAAARVRQCTRQPEPAQGGLNIGLDIEPPDFAPDIDEEDDELLFEQEDIVHEQLPEHVPEPEPAPQQPPWDGHREIPFDIIARESPKDRFVEQYNASPDPYLLKAIEISYALVGRDLWGTASAERLITDLVGKFHSYTKQTGEGLA